MHASPSLRISIAGLLALAGVLAVLGGLPARQASAQAFTVTKTADTNDGVCDADCSLREAVIAANALAGHDNISIPAGTYVLTGAAGENASASGDLDVTDGVSFNGADEATTIIDAGGIEDGVEVLGGSSFILTDLTLTNAGDDGVAGGAADVSLVHTTIKLSGGDGISTSTGAVDLVASTIDSNESDGIGTGSGIITLSTSTVSANWNDGVTTNTGEIIATNSTISSNGSVGVYANNGDVTLNWVTVAGNSERGAGVGNSGLMIFTGVLLAGNDGGDCNTGVEADSYSLDTDGSCGLGLTSVSNGVANLGPLQNNGGTTETHDLMAGSDAIDNGGNGCPEDDQRYFARGVGPACDIGAVELQGTPATATATATPCDGECPTETATSVTIKTHTPTATATAAATNTPMLASTNTPAAAATATPQGGQGGAVRGPDTGSGGGDAGGGNGLFGVIALAVAGSVAAGMGLMRRRA